MRRAPSPEPTRAAPAASSRPRAARCSRRDRRHADGSPDSPSSCAATGRIHHCWRPNSDQERRPHHRRHQQGPANPDPAGPVPRGPVLPAECGSAPSSASSRASGGYSRPDPPLLQPRRTRGPAAKADRPGWARPHETLPVAGQRARTGKPRAPARRALSAGNHHRCGDRYRIGAARGGDLGKRR